MADEKIILEVSIDNEAAQKNATKLTKELIQQRKELSELRKTIRENGEATDEQAKRQVELTNDITQNSKELRLNNRVLQSNEGSKAANEAQTALLIAESKKLNLETKEGRADFEILSKAIVQNTKVLKDQEAAQNNFRRNVGNYTNSIIEASNASNLFGGQLGDVFQAAQTVNGTIPKLIGGLKGLRAAVAATGVGLLVIALTSIVQLINRNEKAARFFQKILRAVGGVVGSLLDKLADFGSFLVDLATGSQKASKSLTSAFNSVIDPIAQVGINLIELFVPFEKVQEIATRVFESIKNGINEVIGLFDGFGDRVNNAFDSLVSGFDSVASSLFGVENASSQITEGINSAIEKTTEVFKPLTDAVGNAANNIVDFGNGLTDAAKGGFDLAASNINLRASIRALGIEQAKATAEAEKARKERDDENKTLEERLAANDAVLEAERRRTEAQTAQTNARIQLLENERKVQGRLTEEQLDELATLNEELFNIQEDFLGRTTEQQTEAFAIRNEEAIQQAESEVARQEANLAQQTENTEAFFNAQAELLREQRELADTQAQAEIQDQARLQDTLLKNEAEFNKAIQELDIEREATRLDNQKAALDAQLLVLEEGTQERLNKQLELIEIEREQELNQLALTEEQKLLIEAQFEADRNALLKESSDARIEQEQSELEATTAIEQAKIGVFQQGLNLAKSIFGEQSAIGKAIFALQQGLAVAEITTNLQKELSAIAAASAANPANALTAGGAGAAQYGVQSAIAIARAGIGIGTVLAQTIQGFMEGGSLAGGGQEGTKQTGIKDNLLGFAPNIGAFAFGGEEFITNKRASLNNLEALKTINAFGANQKFSVIPQFQTGGIVEAQSSQQVESQFQLNNAIRNLPQPVVTVSDISKGFNNVGVSERGGNIG